MTTLLVFVALACASFLLGLLAAALCCMSGSPDESINSKHAQQPHRPGDAQQPDIEP